MDQLADGCLAPPPPPLLLPAAILDELAAEHGFSYTVAKADIDEKAIRIETPRDLVLALAHAKAVAICARMAQQRGEGGGVQRGLLLTCDQVGVCQGLGGVAERQGGCGVGQTTRRRGLLLACDQVGPPWGQNALWWH